MPLSIRKQRSKPSSSCTKLKQQHFTAQGTLDLFRKPNPTKYDLSIFTRSYSITQHPKFKALLSLLRTWNERVQNHKQRDASGVMMIKMRFIYSNLMHLLNMSPQNQQTVLERVHKWSKVSQPNYLQLPARKPNAEQDERKVRMTYKSTLPQQLHVYERKVLLPSQNKMLNLNERSRQITYHEYHAQKASQEAQKMDGRYRWAKIRLQQALNRSRNVLEVTGQKKWQSSRTTPRLTSSNAIHSTVEDRLITTDTGENVTDVSGMGLIPGESVARRQLKLQKGGD